MQGIAVGRAVDLTRFDCYEDLLKKLEEMFEITGELSGSTKKWQVVYTDDEDDMMMVGDDPWQLSHIYLIFSLFYSYTLISYGSICLSFTFKLSHFIYVLSEH